MNIPSHFPHQTQEILQILPTNQKVKIQNRQENLNNKIQIATTLTITDNVITMIVKQLEYVECLTGYKNGFIFNDKSIDNFIDEINDQIIPVQYRGLWNFISNSELKKCRKMKIFLNKMLASKNYFFLKEFFQIYFQCLENILYIQNKFKNKEFNQRQLIQFSKLFSKNFLKRVVQQNQFHQFIAIDQKYANIALLNRQHQIKQIQLFQSHFLGIYNTWKLEFGHLIQVIYYCISVQFYDLEVNYLYEGYFKNTEFTTERGIPKFNIKT